MTATNAPLNKPMDMKLVNALVKIRLALDRGSLKQDKLRSDLDRLWREATSAEWNEYKKRTQ